MPTGRASPPRTPPPCSGCNTTGWMPGWTSHTPDRRWSSPITPPTSAACIRALRTPSPAPGSCPNAPACWAAPIYGYTVTRTTALTMRSTAHASSATRAAIAAMASTKTRISIPACASTSRAASRPWPRHSAVQGQTRQGSARPGDPDLGPAPLDLQALGRQDAQALQALDIAGALHLHDADLVAHHHRVVFGHAEHPDFLQDAGGIDLARM